MSAEMHSDFRTVVATQYGAVVDKSHVHPVASRSHGGAHSRDTSSYDHHVVGRPLRFTAVKTEQATAHHGKFLAIVRKRGFAGTCGHVDCVAAAVEAGEVMQGKCVCALSEFYFSRFLPTPAGTTVSQCL